MASTWSDNDDEPTSAPPPAAPYPFRDRPMAQREMGQGLRGFGNLAARYSPQPDDDRR